MGDHSCVDIDAVDYKRPSILYHKTILRNVQRNEDSKISGSAKVIYSTSGSGAAAPGSIPWHPLTGDSPTYKKKPSKLLTK